MVTTIEYICDVCSAKSENKNFLKKLNLELQINGNVAIQINKDLCPDCSGGLSENNTKAIKNCLIDLLENKYKITLKKPEEQKEIQEESCQNENRTTSLETINRIKNNQKGNSKK